MSIRSTSQALPVEVSLQALMPELLLECAAVSCRGKSRRANEDQFLIAAVHPTLAILQTSVPELRRRPNSAAVLLAVADGMGGEGSGEIASSEAVIALARYVRRALAAHLTHAPRPNGHRGNGELSLPGVRDGLHDAFARCHGRIMRRVRRGGVSPTMGTTLTAVLVCWPQLYLAHAGDSRCYLVRGGAAERLTVDHTLAAQLEAAGLGAPDIASPLHHVLFNALGGGGHAEHRADVRRVELGLGDVVLLCSDGVTKYLDDDHIAAIVCAAPSAASAVEALAGEAVRRGGSDDITAIVARTRQLQPH